MRVIGITHAVRGLISADAGHDKTVKMLPFLRTRQRKAGQLGPCGTFCRTNSCVPDRTMELGGRAIVPIPFSHPSPIRRTIDVGRFDFPRRGRAG